MKTFFVHFGVAFALIVGAFGVIAAPVWVLYNVGPVAGLLATAAVTAAAIAGLHAVMENT